MKTTFKKSFSQNGAEAEASRAKSISLYFLRASRFAKPSRGFTVLFAALIASLLLAVGLAIFDIVFKEVSFATVVRDSNYAIYAADTGIECAEYWDSQCGTAGVCNAGFTSAFATSTASQTYPPLSSGSQLICAGQDILTDNQEILTPTQYPPVPPTANSATTNFAIYLDKDQVPYCAIVQVMKSDTGTIIISRGYNTCDTTDPNRIERALDTSY